MTDWINDPVSNDGIQYTYNAASQLTKITDYYDDTLTYLYDAVGNVTKMTDYHGNVTTYAYT